MKVCPKFKPGIPVILHIRSNSEDKYSERLYEEAFEILKSHCHTSQRIVLHCCTANYTTVKFWQQHFPHTYFGFTLLVTSFDQSQLQAVREDPENRHLAETDSPYMPPIGIKVNSPMYIGEVVEVMATMRFTDVQTIALCTTKNAINLFG